MSSPTKNRDDFVPTPASGPRPADADQGLNSLVSGILADMQRLLGQHLELLHQEIREDFRKTKEAVLAIGLAGSLAAAGAILLIPMLIGLLSWAVPAVPWWGWCGILAAVFFVVAVALYYGGKKKLESFNPLPDQSVGAVKENLEWIGNQVTSTTPK